MKEIEQVRFENNLNPDSQFDLIRIEELLSRDLEFPPTQLHKIGFYNIIIITKGIGKHTIDFTDYSYQKGSLLTIRKDQLHRFHAAPNTQGYMLIFTENFLASQLSSVEVSRSIQLFNELLSNPKINLNKKEFEEISQLIDSIEQDYFNHYDQYSDSIIRSTLHILTTKLFRIKSYLSQPLQKKKYLDDFAKFQKLIEEHCFEKKKVMDYAKLMNCTTKTLNNITNSILGKSAKILIDEVRITQIKRLLINTNLPIKEIAYTSGFEEPSNLYRYFKNYSGFSPDQFRQAH